MSWLTSSMGEAANLYDIGDYSRLAGSLPNSPSRARPPFSRWTTFTIDNLFTNTWVLQNTGEEWSDVEAERF